MHHSKMTAKYTVASTPTVSGVNAISFVSPSASGPCILAIRYGSGVRRGAGIQGEEIVVAPRHGVKFQGTGESVGWRNFDIGNWNQSPALLRRIQNAAPGRDSPAAYFAQASNCASGWCFPGLLVRRIARGCPVALTNKRGGDCWGSGWLVMMRKSFLVPKFRRQPLANTNRRNGNANMHFPDINFWKSSCICRVS